MNSLSLHIIEKDHQDSIEKWDFFVEKNAMPPQAYWAWKEHLENVFKVTAIALSVMDENDNVKGICLVYFKTHHDVLYSCRHSFFAQSDDAAKILNNEIGRICRENNISKTLVSSGRFERNIGQKLDEKEALYLPLECESEEDLWLSIPKKTKNMIRKAEKSNLQIKNDWTYLPLFYQAYCERFVALGLNIKSFEHFQSIQNIFGGRAVLLSVFQDEEYVAGMIFISAGDVVSYAYNASNLSASNSGANNLLIWEAMKLFFAKRAKYIDLSESKPGSPVYKFKSRLSKNIDFKKIYYFNCAETSQGTQSAKQLSLVLFVRYKIYGLLQRLLPIMPKPLKRKYLQHAGHQGRVI